MSTDADDISRESKKHENSVFTHALLEALMKEGKSTGFTELPVGMSIDEPFQGICGMGMGSGHNLPQDFLLATPPKDPRPAPK